MELDHKTMSRCSASKGSSSKTHLFKTKGGKCHRPGPVLRNPYLNFLREFRRRNCGLSAVEIIRRGAKEWKTMPKETKLQYIEEAKAAKPVPRRRKLLPKNLLSRAKKEKEVEKVEKPKVWTEEKSEKTQTETQRRLQAKAKEEAQAQVLKQRPLITNIKWKI